MSKEFWGLVVVPSEPADIRIVERAFRVSTAALDVSVDSTAFVQLMLACEDNTYILCTLDKNQPQSRIDLCFERGDEIAFFCNGNESVHLAGCVYSCDSSDSSDDSSDEITFKGIPKPPKMKKKVFAQSAKKISLEDFTVPKNKASKRPLKKKATAPITKKCLDLTEPKVPKNKVFKRPLDKKATAPITKKCLDLTEPKMPKNKAFKRPLDKKATAPITKKSEGGKTIKRLKKGNGYVSEKQVKVRSNLNTKKK